MALTSKLVPYRSDWPDLFSAEKAALESTLGDLVLGICHVGSTAIPEIPLAKPEIDIAMSIPDLEQIETINTGMRALGYNVRGGNSEGHRYFSKNLGKIRTHKAHITVQGHPHIVQQIVFRDYMRDHPEDTEAYCRLKEKLVAENTTGMLEYVEGKDGFIQAILEAAKSAGYVKPLEECV